MASSQLTSAPTVAATSTENIPAAKDNESAANDPDFAIICAFLQKFAKDVGVDIPNFGHLHGWLVNTDEVSQQLRDMHIKLLRKTRKTVHEKCWESALSKFCFTYSAQDAWEIERFGYKKSSLKVKLRILRELLESQFERNNKFRTKFLTFSADSLRSQPIGRDKHGHTYWLTQDDDCNLRIYQEHLDEEIWRVVARNREELVNLIARLRGNEVVLPSTDIGIVDEDTSSSNSCAAPVERPPPPEEQDDSQEEPALKVPNIRIRLGGNKNKLDQEEYLSVVSETNINEDEKIKSKNDSKPKENEESAPESKTEQTKKVKPLIISQRGASSPSVSSGSKRRNNDDDSVSPPPRDDLNVKRSRPSLLDSRRSNKPSKYFKPDEEASSSLDDGELDEEEAEEEDIDSVAAEEDENEEKDIEEYDDEFETEIGEAVEDPTVYVRGNGAGNDCDGGNDNQHQNEQTLYLSAIDDYYDAPTFSELIEEPVLFVFGEGNGFDCLVGNKDEENPTSSNEPKATFFFGEPGCLKLSPIKLNPSPTASSKQDEKAIAESKLDADQEDKKTQCDKDIPTKNNDSFTGESEKPLTSLKTEETEVSTKNEGRQHELNGENELSNLEKTEKVETSNKMHEEKIANNDDSTLNEVQPNPISKDKNGEVTEDAKEIEEKHLKLSDQELSDVNDCNDHVVEEKQISSNVDEVKTLETQTKSPAKDESSETIKEDDKQSHSLQKPEPESEKVEDKKDNEKGSFDKKDSVDAIKLLDTNSITKIVPKVQTSVSERPETEITTITTSQTKNSQEQTAPNRKRRLVDFHKPLQSQHSTSESDLDPHTDRQDDSPVKDDLLEDIGGKRLKMRSKCSNSEIRKKVEAKLDANLEETTSSSGDEDATRPRKTISPKKETQKLPEQQTNDEPSIKTEDKKINAMPAVIAATSCSSIPTTSAGMAKPKPSLSEIIEKKLKKTPPKSEEPSPSIQAVFMPPKKTPITKPLKKNLLTQLRESDEEAVPRKRTLSNASTVQNTATTSLKAGVLDSELKELKPKVDELKEIAIHERNSERKTPEKEVPAEKIQPERNSVERKTPERQRKRQNSEEPSTGSATIVESSTGSNDDAVDKVKKSREAANEVDKAKKPISNETEKQVNTLKAVAAGKTKDFGKLSNQKSEIVEDTSSTGSVGRRSSRRCAGSVLYAELPQIKRTRGGVKPSTKIEVAKEEKVAETVIKAEIKIEKPGIEPIKTKTNDVVVAVKAPLGLQTPKNEIKGEKKPNKAINKPTGKSNLKNPVKSDVAAENVEDQIKANIVKKPISTAAASTPVAVLDPGPSPVGPGRGRGPRKKREVDTTNIIDEDSETPVRQSRRIAQQKIREEAERRKLEEIALRTMKQELKKKKKAEKEADPTVVEPSEQSSSSSDSEVETKKKSKKKCPGKDGWSSGSEEVEEPEEEDEYPHHYETDVGSPLFKSDHEFSPESDLEDETQVVPMKRARTARKEDAEDEHGPGDEEACQKCGKSDHPEWILLCDICDKGYHCSCLSPVLFYIPEGDWHCPPCQQEQLIAALEKQLQEFDEIVEKKRIANEEEKRLAELAEREEQERLKVEEEQRKERRKQKQKKRHRDDSSNENSSASSENEGHHDNDEDGANEKSISKLNRRDDGSDDESKTSKLNKRNADNADKNKRRRGEGRNRRRRAATRGARRRRRLDKSSGSGSGSDSDDSDSSSRSGSESSSDSFSDSDDEPIYKLRKRRQINVSYRLNEYDDLINSALKKEMDEVAGAGNAGRGKDITTIIEADKEEKARLKQIEEKENDAAGDDEEKHEEGKDSLNEEAQKNSAEHQEDSDDEKPLKSKFKTRPTIKKKSRKLTTLDISSEEDNASDEDFKTSSLDDDEEDEDTSISASTDSDTSLEIFRRRGKNGKKKQRKAARRAARERRKVKKFVVDDSDDEEVKVKSKKKRKDESDYTESETDENDELSELSENIDSADLCDDTTSEDSDGAWHPSKRKKQRKAGGVPAPRNSGKQKKPQAKKVKQLEYSDDDISETEEEEEDDDDDVAGGGKGSGKQPRSVPLIPVNSNKSNNGGKKGKPSAAGKKKQKKKQSEEELSFSDSEDSTRRTRGRRYAYIEDFDDDSSDGGIKPGVKRPDTPPEEREKFIKKQEEIKRMLAEKNAEGAKLAATPRLTPIKAVSGVTCSDKDKRSPAKLGQDSLSTVPLSVIRQAKVLDIDYLQRKGELIGDLDNPQEVDSEFDDADLPDDLPEDMDEDAIARMVEEEEEFGATAATRELPPPDEVLRTPNKPKTKDTPTPIQKSTTNPSLEALSQMQGGAAISAISVPPPTVSGLQEPTRKRLPMPTLHPPLLRHQYPHPPHTQSGNIMLHGGVMPRHAPPTHLLQNALSAPLGQPLNRTFPIQHAHGATHPMPSRQLLPPTRPVHGERPPASTAGPSGTGGPPLEGETKPRGRRKKITPLRDSMQKQAASSTAATTTIQTNKTTSSEMLATRVSAVVSSGSSVIKSSAPILSVAQPPQLYKSQADISLGSETQTSVITRMPHLPPGRMIFPGADVARFYSALPPPGAAGPPRQLPPNTQRQHRGPPLQMPPGLPPPPISTSSYVPPHARHAPSHLSPYRPTIYGNPSYGQPRSLATTTASIRIGVPPPPTTGPEYLAGPRPFPPYGYYPPPPPLTTAHLPTPPSSVIVAAPPSSITTTAPPVIIQTPTISTITTHAESEHAPPIDLKSTSTEEITPSNKPTPEPSKKLITLDVYTPSNAKSPLGIGGGESSGSQPEAAEDSPTSAAQSQAKAGEFSGLVSYFSSQHDDYNT